MSQRRSVQKTLWHIAGKQDTAEGGGHRACNCPIPACTFDGCRLSVHSRTLAWDCTHCRANGQGFEELYGAIHRIDAKKAAAEMKALFGDTAWAQPDKAWIAEQERIRKINEKRSNLPDEIARQDAIKKKIEADAVLNKSSRHNRSVAEILEEATA